MEKKNEIIYDEGFSKPSKPLDNADEKEPVPVDEQERKERSYRPLLISIQLVLCLLTALALFFLKSSGSSLYTQFERWYNDQMRMTLISQNAFESVDLSRFFSRASVDEVPRR